MNSLRLGSREAAAYCRVIGMSEDACAESAEQGVYIGKTRIYKIPFVLDLDMLVNPHISVAGMTGSGKTYLLKSLVVRHRLLRQYNVFLIDWNGEYKDVVPFLNGSIHRMKCGSNGMDADSLLHGVNCLDLSGMNDNARVEYARAALDAVLEYMHSLSPGRKADSMIVVDEAWKLLAGYSGLAGLFREARKYGFCMVTATQLVNDVDNAILSNSACNFIFRLQGTENTGALASSGLADSRLAEMVRGLKRGSCLVSLSLRSSGFQKRFIIDRVDGVPLDDYSIRCDGMVVRVQQRKLDCAMEELGLPAEERARLLRFFEENGRRVGLPALVKALGRAKLARPHIVFFLRRIGIGDIAISAALESSASG